MDWKYIAGFFDGEGTITKTETRHRLAISQTNLEVLERIVQYSGMGTIVPLTKREAHWKDAWVLFVGEMHNVHHFLSHMLPYLIVKRPKAVITIKEIEARIIAIEERQRIKTARIARAKQLRQQGLSYRAIGKELNIDWGYARHIINGTK